MTIDDLDAFGKIMAVVNEVFGDPGREVSDMRMRFYFHSLEDLSIAGIETAVLRLGRTRTFHTFPTPGEIREALGEMHGDRAEQAFDTLMEAIRHTGLYRTPLFHDRIIRMVVEAMGGWRAVCGWTIDERRWRRKEFVRTYLSCREQTWEGGVPAIAGEWAESVGSRHHKRVRGLDEPKSPLPWPVHRLPRLMENPILPTGERVVSRCQRRTGRVGPPDFRPVRRRE